MGTRKGKRARGGIELRLDRALMRKADALRDAAAQLSGTIPSKELVVEPLLFRKTRLKRAAAKEREQGLFAVDDEAGSITSRRLEAVVCEARFHIDQNFRDWAALLQQIVSALGPFASAVAAYEAEAGDAAGPQRRGRNARRAAAQRLGRLEGLREEALVAAYNIDASGLEELYRDIVGRRGGTGLAEARARLILNRLLTRERIWVEYARMEGAERALPTVAGYLEEANRAFQAAHPGPFRSLGRPRFEAGGGADPASVAFGETAHERREGR